VAGFGNEICTEDLRATARPYRGKQTFVFFRLSAARGTLLLHGKMISLCADSKRCAAKG
jgi:hypothetical protein